MLGASDSSSEPLRRVKNVLRITVDTTSIGPDRRGRIEAMCEGRPVDIGHTSVTDRETRGTSFATSDASLLEVGVWDESEWGSAVYGGPSDEKLFESVLDVISNGAFPRQREQLSEGQRHQMRDAMILLPHVRGGRDVFVSDDRKAFIEHGRREELEALCRTRIMTTDEFCSWISKDVRE
jgi:hypothetical protein